MEPSEPTSRGEITDPLWARAKVVLGDALELPPEERAVFIEEACAGQPELQREVESLMPSEGTADSFLARPVPELFDTPAPALGTRVGGYTLRALIGEGGMGRVYEASQEHPHRTVALKILRPGFLAADAERRFHYEIEALGRLSHPAIAAIHDAGVESVDGGHRLSWFAMEKVSGRPMLAAADELRLDDSDRLRLFLRVADGVAHAHQRGVIHRDLKPDNILVDDEARPHLLDFGIARAADPMASSMTTAGEIVGTLAYMSPEQLLGEPDQVDARSDVYALGVLLFRMMTGKPPHDLQGLGLPQVALRVAQAEASRAGAIRRDLRGSDLETVLGKALERDPDQRYSSVESMARDVERVLDHEPIEARAPSAWYQVRKFARRHRGLVAGVLLAVAALVMAAVGTSVGLYRASVARDLAITERDHARAINELVTRMFASADPLIDGRDVRVIDLLDAAREELVADTADDSTMPPRTRAGLNLTLGNTYRMLSLHEDALPLLERAESLYDDLDGPAAASTVEALGDRVSSLVGLGRLDEADPLALELRARTDALDDPSDAMFMRPFEVESHIADMTGDVEAIESASRAVLEGWIERAAPGSPELETARLNYAVALMDNDRYAEALKHLREGKRRLEEGQGIRSSTLLAVNLSMAQSLSNMGQPDIALLRYQELMPRAVEQWGPDHDNTLSMRSSMANALSSLGRHGEAVSLYEDILAATVRMNEPGHINIIRAMSNLGATAQSAGQHEMAIAQFQNALDALDASQIDDLTLQVRTRMNLATALEATGKDAEALASNRSSLEWLEANLSPEHSLALVARNNTAMMLVKMGSGEEALALAQRNLDVSKETQPDAPMNVFPLQMNLGRALAAAGEADRAESELLDVRAKLQASELSLPSQLARIDEILSEFYVAENRPDEAARYQPAPSGK